MIRKLKLSVENVRKLLLDDHADRLQKNTHMIKRKEEATIAAKELDQNWHFVLKYTSR